MTANLDFDRQVAAWLDVAWPSNVAPEMVDAALHEARSVRRPGRAVRLVTGPAAWPATHELWLLGRRRSLARVALALLLIAALIAGALAVGSQLPRPTKVSLRGILADAGTIPGEGLTPDLHATLLADGRVLVQGYNALYAWDPSSHVFVSLGTTSLHRAGSELFTMPDGRVAIVGGETGFELGSSEATTVEFLDVQSKSTTTPIPMQVARTGQRSMLLRDGRLLVVGGSELRDGGPVNSIEIFDPAQGTWRVAGSTNGALTAPTLVQLADGRVLITNLYGPNIATFDPVTDQVSPLDAPAAEVFGTAVELSDGRVLLSEHSCEDSVPMVGGHDTNLDGSPTQIFDPVAGSFSPWPALPQCVSTATVLSDGHVLYTGYAHEPLTYPEIQGGAYSPVHTWAGLLDPATGDVRTVAGLLGHFVAVVPLPDGRAVLMVGNEVDSSDGSGTAQILE